jgi:LPXTG-site transpeptidase (sortase) family protein
MPSYFKPVRYQKKVETENFFKNRNISFWGNSTLFPAIPFFIAFLLIITQIVIPLYFFKTKATVPNVATKSVLGYSTGYRDFAFNELKELPSQTSPAEDLPAYFYITIPKLGIYSAMVETDSTNLSPDASIGHYKGSSYPGNGGTSYLYGHSVLPIFYNPRNYKTIFSKLDKLNAGDEVLINFLDKTYVYKVTDSQVLAVSQVNPLANKTQNDPKASALVLMTCWPAGTKAKRMEVTAVRY